jgi:chemotaxis protein CheD
MTHSKRLNTGDARIGLRDDILITDGIGSCVVICLWDEKTKTGGMAHMPMASSRDRFPSKGYPPLGIAPDIALPFLLSMMEARGSFKRNITVRLVGGGNMFSGYGVGPMSTIGENITNQTLEAVRLAGLIVVGRCVGGFFGKAVEFSMETGIINVAHTNGVRESL